MCMISPYIAVVKTYNGTVRYINGNTTTVYIPHGVMYMYMYN